MTDLEPIEGVTVIHCEVCGSELMVPPEDADAVLGHYDDGSHTSPAHKVYRRKESVEGWVAYGEGEEVPV